MSKQATRIITGLWCLKLLCAAALLFLAEPEPVRGLAPDKDVLRYGHAVFRTENGLPQNTVRAILQTRDGYLWLATDEGLARFDGQRFTVFDKQNTDAIKSNNIQVLHEDRQGSLWIGTDGGLVRFQDQRFTAFSTKDGLAQDNIGAICEDASGGLWIGTPAGLCEFKGNNHFAVYTTQQGLPSNSVGALYADRDNTVWISTPGGLGRLSGSSITAYTTRDGLPGGSVGAICQSRDGDFWFGASGGLARFKDGKFTLLTTREGLPNNIVWSIREDRDGSLWVGTDGGLSRLKDGAFRTFTTADGLCDNCILSIHPDRDGNIWLGTPGGVSRVAHGKISAYAAKDGLSNNVVLSVYEDREGSVWVGTEGGLNVFKDTKLITYTSRDGLADDMIWTVCQGRDGSLWIGSQSGGLNRVKDGKFTAYSVNDGLPSNTVRALCEDHEGALWIGGPKGLGCFKNGRFTTYTIQDGLSSNAVWSIHEDASANLWIGTLGGLTQMHDGKFTIYTSSDGLSDDAILSLASTSDGSLWVGTRSGGLSHLKDGQFTTYSVSDGLSDNNIRAIYEDKDGALWIGTRRGGLDRFKDGRFSACTAKDGLFDDCVFQIIEDRKGELWMSCAKGIFRASRQELNDFAEGKLRAITSTSYGAADGMENRECNGGQPAGCLSTDGKLWFATVKGVATIDPGNIKTNQELPPVAIEQVVVDNQPLGPTALATAIAPANLPARTELPSRVSRLEFQYVGLSFVAPEKVRYQYKLEGFEKQWIDAGARRVATYTSIPPGNYTFRVRACNNDGVWNEAGAAFDFHLQPHFYQTYWFYVALAAAAGLIAWSLYRLRLNQVEGRFSAVLAERGRMAREIHDTLAQGFVGISLQLQAVEKVLSDSPQTARQHLQLAQTMAEASLTEASRTVWDLRAKALESGDLAAALRDAAQKLTKGTSVEARFKVTGDPYRLPGVIENHLLRIGQEAITNAMKHARPQTIAVEISFDSNQTRLRVSDDGCGFDARAGSPNGHFGLVGMRERVGQIKGNLAVNSRPGEGTEILVTVGRRSF